MDKELKNELENLFHKKFTVVFRGDEVRDLFKPGEKGYVLGEITINMLFGDIVDKSAKLRSFILKDPSKNIAEESASTANGGPVPPCVPKDFISGNPVTLSQACVTSIETMLNTINGETE